jgi:hypothetical protein
MVLNTGCFPYFFFFIIIIIIIMFLILGISLDFLCFIDSLLLLFLYVTFLFSGRELCLPKVTP